MSFKQSSAKMYEINDDNNNDYFNSRYRTQSTSYLVLNDSTSVKSLSPKQNRSETASAASSPIASSSSKINTSSQLRISSPNPKTSISSSPDDRFVMTIIRSPSTSSQRILSMEPVGPTVMNEELSNNKFFKSKVTAALNHMKYRWVVKMRPNFRTNESPIYLLGKMYNGKEGQ
ncbi:unnamed protein product [Rotaria magnacalcarata]|uniref:Uncharacterized protein n=1 Tax=Rotaria magnacalcarata TaxID=392030 RepID=A0A8S3FDW3_9BILA|nr:unnamed protein product [Rotaria magnacalcarata]